MKAAEAQVDVVLVHITSQAAEVTQVSANPHTVAEEHHHAASGVDAKAVLIQVEEIIHIVEPAAEQPGAPRNIRPHAATGLAASWTPSRAQEWWDRHLPAPASNP